MLLYTSFFTVMFVELSVGIEPTFSDYETEVLPLNDKSVQLRVETFLTTKKTFVDKEIWHESGESFSNVMRRCVFQLICKFLNPTET